MALGLSTSASSAHDFWIIPDAFRIATGQPLVVRTATGTNLPLSESAVRQDQVAEAKVLSATPATDQPLGAFSISGKSLIVEHRPSAHGQRMVAFALRPSSRRVTGEGLARYLRLERYAKEGRLPTDSVLLRSTRYAGMLVEAARGGPTAFGGSAGQALEIIPSSDPSAAQAQVHAGRAPAEGSPLSPTSAVNLAAASSGDDSVSARRAVEMFHEALARGDSIGALAMLSSDLVVLESGEVERYAEYRSHHLAADIAFERAIPPRHALVTLGVDGNTAWVASTSITQGQFNKRPVNSVGAELMVLTRTASDTPWRIRAIHWSSHRRSS